MVKSDLMTTQARVLAFITDYQAAHNHAPTNREIAAAVGLDLNTIPWLLETLQYQGRIRRYRSWPRRIEVL